jgi:hypothetical protein
MQDHLAPRELTEGPRLLAEPPIEVMPLITYIASSFHGSHCPRWKGRALHPRLPAERCKTLFEFMGLPDDLHHTVGPLNLPRFRGHVRYAAASGLS